MTIVRAPIKRPGIKIGEPPPIFGGPYTARGVQFSSSYLLNNSLNTGGRDNGAFSFSFWAQSFTSSNTNIFFVGNPLSQNGYEPFCRTAGASNPLLVINFAGGSGIQLQLTYGPFSSSDTDWHHYLGSFYTNYASGQKLGLVYIDDIFQSPAVQDFNRAFVNPISGLPFYVGGDGMGLTFNGAMSDVWIYPNKAIISVNKDGTPLISDDTRRAFTSLSAVNEGFLVPNNPANFPNAPIIFTGSAGSFGANFGFGGPFGLVGALTDVQGPGQIPIP